MRSSLLPSADVTELQTTEAYSNFDLTAVTHNTYKQSRNENPKDMGEWGPKVDTFWKLKTKLCCGKKVLN
jgi:hypothetical protein